MFFGTLVVVDSDYNNNNRMPLEHDVWSHVHVVCRLCTTHMYYSSYVVLIHNVDELLDLLHV